MDLKNKEKEITSKEVSDPENLGVIMVLYVCRIIQLIHMAAFSIHISSPKIHLKYGKT